MVIPYAANPDPTISLSVGRENRRTGFTIVPIHKSSQALQ